MRGTGLGSLINAYADLEGDSVPIPPSSSSTSTSSRGSTLTAKKIAPKVSATTTAAKKIPSPASTTNKKPAAKPATTTATTTTAPRPKKAHTATGAGGDATSNANVFNQVQLQPLPQEKIQEDYYNNNTKDFQKQLDAIKNSLNNDDDDKNNRKFTQEWPDKEEASKYQWMRLSDLAKSTNSSLQLFPGNSASNISGTQVAQGSEGDCYVHSVISVLAQQQNESQKKLIESLFVVKEINDQCIYAVRLWSCGKWHNIIMDDKFPVVESTTSNNNNKKTKLLFSSTRTTTSDDESSSSIVMWVPLLEKALATLHGSYGSLRGGVSMEAFLDMTGFPVRKIRFRPPSATTTTTTSSTSDTNNSSTASSPQELTRKMTFYFKTSCVMAASCGGGSVRDANATKAGLHPSHSYSVLKLLPPSFTINNSTPMILLRDPHGSTAYDTAKQTAKLMKPQDIPPLQPGEFLLSVEQFMTYYNLLVVCITHPFEQVISGSKSAICSSATSFLPSNFAECAVEFEIKQLRTESMSTITPYSALQVQAKQTRSSKTPSSGAAAVASSSSSINLYAMASQPQIRPSSSSGSSSSSKNNSTYHDLCVVILKLPSNSPSISAIPKVVAMSEVNVDRISFMNCKISEPGHYIAFPMSFTQQQHQNTHQSNPKDLFVTLMVEKTTAGAVAFTPVAPTVTPTSELNNLILSSCNKWFFKFVETHPDVEARLAHNNLWDIFKWSHGLLRCSLVRNSAKASGGGGAQRMSSITATPQQHRGGSRTTASANSSNPGVTTIIEVDTAGSIHTTCPGRQQQQSKNSNGDDETTTKTGIAYTVTLAPRLSCVVHLSVPLPWDEDEGIQINSAIAWKFKTDSSANASSAHHQQQQQGLPKLFQAF